MEENYKSVDQPELFEFHDAIFTLDRAEREEIAVYVDAMNISKDAEQNPKGYDLSINKAHIVFHAVSDCTFERKPGWERDAQGNWVPVGQEVIYRDADAMDRIREALRKMLVAVNNTIVDGDFFSIMGTDADSLFEIRFKARRIEVTWDKYTGPAWYEEVKFIRRNVVLITPTGETTREAHIRIYYDPDELFRADDAEDVDPKEIRIWIQYEGKEYGGHGTDVTSADQEAFADLQKQLPDGVALKCCLSCAHGNRSPFSNAYDLLYCMKDTVISDKRDLCPYVTGDEEEKRRRRYTDVCDDWAEQNDTVFVYSDYPCFFKK